jgi:hypothetical protein
MPRPNALQLLLDCVVSLVPPVAFVALRRARRRERAADKAGKLLMEELLQVQGVSAERGALIVQLEGANYRLACELHGKSAVGKAIRDAHDRGTN